MLRHHPRHTPLSLALSLSLSLSLSILPVSGCPPVHHPLQLTLFSLAVARLNPLVPLALVRKTRRRVIDIIVIVIVRASWKPATSLPLTLPLRPITSNHDSDGFTGAVGVCVSLSRKRFPPPENAICIESWPRVFHRFFRSFRLVSSRPPAISTVFPNFPFFFFVFFFAPFLSRLLVLFLPRVVTRPACRYASSANRRALLNTETATIAFFFH